MSYAEFSRVPNTCGIWKKLKSLDTEKWLRTVLGAYLDETTKQRQDGWGEGALLASTDERRALIAEGKVPMLPGEDFTPFASGVWVFGHVASKLAESGGSEAFAQPKDVIARLTEWWVRDRSQSEIKGHHVVASFDDRIAKELHLRGYPVDAMLLSSLHQTLSQYAARFYPKATLGWVAGCHHDRAHSHVHALIHPTTSDGTLIRLSSPDGGEKVEDKYHFLRLNFNNRCRKLFVGLTQREGPKEEVLSVSARQLMLLSRHAVGAADPQASDTFPAVAATLDKWTGAKDYGAVLNAAANAAEEEYRMTEPGTPDPNAIRVRWGEIHDSWDQKRASHLGTAIEAFRTVIASRNAPDSYSPVRSTFTSPTVPMESDYFALASQSAGKTVTDLDGALEARLAASGKIRSAVSKALAAYQGSLERCRTNLDATRVQAVFGASEIAFHSALSLGIPLRLKEAGLRDAGPPQRALLPTARMEAVAERELSSLASVEGAAHQPEDPNAVPALLASSHYPRFKSLAEPALQLAEQSPTIGW